MSPGADGFNWTFPGHSLCFLLVVGEVSPQLLFLSPLLCHDGLLSLWASKPDTFTALEMAFGTGFHRSNRKGTNTAPLWSGRPCLELGLTQKWEELV